MTQQLLTNSAPHGLSISGIADSGLNRLRDLAILGISPMSTYAESAATTVFQRITKGHLTIVTSTRTYTYPPTDSECPNEMPTLRARLRVVNDTFWIRLGTMFDLGFAEAYMYGEVECDDIVALLQVFIYNQEKLQDLGTRLSWLFTLPQRLTSYRFLNSISNSRSNISAHYDLSNAMFSAFLSKDMTYSCAIFPDLDGDLKDSYTGPALDAKLLNAQRSESETTDETASHSDTSRATTAVTSREVTPPLRHEDPLYAAQMQKLQHVITKARIMPGHHVLEIGSGWGSLSMLIVTTMPKTQIDTLTLSMQQRDYVTQRIEEKGLQDRVRVHYMDYRQMPKEWEGKFDRVISIEMVESVGRENLGDYWRSIDRVLKTKDAAGVIQSITIPEARFDAYAKQVDFIRKWIQVFPGGLLPSLTLLQETLTTATRGSLIVDSVCNIGPHYARTLREWRTRFLANFDKVEQALREEHPGVFDGEEGRYELDVFRRKWIYYFCYCEAGFTTHLINDHIITFTREGNEGMGCDVFE